ncbi:MAG: hypothetical protein ACNS60_12350 [Candidatus Cyclobacteriaceae bacterium M2_1C_046]
MYFIIIILSSIFTTTPNYEQLALDHFTQNILPEEHPDLHKIQYSQRTVNEYYWGIIFHCENWDEATIKKIVSVKPQGDKSVILKTDRYKVGRIRSNSNKLRINVYSSVEVEDSYFVLIQTHRKLRFTQYYLYQFDKSGKLIELCNVGEII